MLNAILVAVRFVILAFGGHKQVALENAALRQQLAVFKRDVKRPKLHGRDRLFWIALRMIWEDWKSALVIVQPETVVSWHRNRFKRYCVNSRARRCRADRRLLGKFVSWFAPWPRRIHCGEHLVCMENC